VGYRDIALDCPNKMVGMIKDDEKVSSPMSHLLLEKH